MSAKARKKLNKISKQPAKRAAADDRKKRSTGTSKARPPLNKGPVPAKKEPVAQKGKPHGKAARKLPAPVKVPAKGTKSSKTEAAKHKQGSSKSEKAKSPVAPRASDKKSRELAKKLEKKAKLREANLKAELKRREAAQKQKEAVQKQKELQLLVAQKQKLADQKKKELLRRAEQKKKEAERQRLLAEAQKKREAEQKAREQEKSRVAAEKLAAKEALRQAQEEEKLRKVQEREAARIAKEQERAQQKAQREAEREEARRLKEEERAKREAEREAYRKAKEAEREKIRAAKEAARRALEGRIAEQNRNANKLGGGRSSTTRIYSPRAIPDQSGTTRRVLTAPAMTAAAVPISESEAPMPEVTADTAATMSAAAVVMLPTPLPPTLGSDTPPKPPAGDGSGSPEDEAAKASEKVQPIPDNVEDRYRVIEERLKAAPDGFNRDYRETIDMSWIHHDSALEGVVYTFQELKSALDPSTPAITDSSLQPVVEEIRRHKQAIDLVRDLGERKRAPITVDTIKKIYVTLHPEEGDIKTVKYRRDIPQHRLYFHEYAHPEKITYKVRQVVDWFNGPEPKKLKSPIRVAARVHYELLRIFPFQTDSGKVARLMMNLILMRAGHPPAIIHSTERQRYYEALKGALPVLVQMVTESIMNSLMSIEKLLDEHDIRQRV